MKNFARMATIRLLHVIEQLNEFRTGKRCIAKVAFAWNLGIGYHRRVEENSVVEFYLFPLTIVSITTFHLGATVTNAMAGAPDAGIIGTLDRELQIQINRHE